MSFKKYGCHNDRLIGALGDIDQRACNTKGKDWDGVTHIVWEWVNGKMFPDKTTLWNNVNGLTRTVSYACYWMDKYMKDEVGHKTGNNWEKVAFKWKDEQVTTFPLSSAIEIIVLLKVDCTYAIPFKIFFLTFFFFE